LDNLEHDEEIVVVDGNSSDGTKEYLESLYQQGKIHQYISEPDKNQAHAWNKALLMARGDLIKKIIDDDLFCFAAIRICKEFMLLHNSYDLCISDSLGTNMFNYQHISTHSDIGKYQDWKSGKIKSFLFGDVSLIVRKDSIPYLGIYDTSFEAMDYEFALRVSYLRAKIAYYTGFNALSVYNPVDSVSSNFSENILKLERRRSYSMYEYKEEISRFSKVKIFVGKTLQRLKIWKRNYPPINNVTDFPSNLDEIYSFCYRYLNEANLNKENIFLVDSEIKNV